MVYFQVLCFSKYPYPHLGVTISHVTRETNAEPRTGLHCWPKLPQSRKRPRLPLPSIFRGSNSLLVSGKVSIKGIVP